MGRSLLDLAESLENRVGAINEEANKVAIKAAITVIIDLAYQTPVDESKALSNWQVGLDSPVDSPIRPYYSGFFGSTQRASAEATIAAAKQVLEKKRPGQVIFISNVLPYINRLNDGYSGQTPAGFVERATLLGRKRVRKAKFKA